MEQDIFDHFRGGVTAEDACPYLPGRRWRNLILDAGELFTPPVHEYLLNQGFRRMGNFVYRPTCDGCIECRPLRVSVASFQPSRGQRRVQKRNDDIELSMTPAAYTEEKRELLARYLEARHDGPMTADEPSMREFMYASPGTTLCMDYRLDGRLVGSGVVDLLPDVVSSIYFFFDPDLARRSLGTFSMLQEIELARSLGRRFFHPGFFISSCAAMSYKSFFKPCEYLHADGDWRPFSA